MRQEGYKAGISVADSRRKREQNTVSIRKKKKNEKLKKRRQFVGMAGEEANAAASAGFVQGEGHQRVRCEALDLAYPPCCDYVALLREICAVEEFVFFFDAENFEILPCSKCFAAPL